MNAMADVSLNRLRNIPLLAGFTDEELRQFSEVGTIRTYKPGEWVLHQGRSSQNLWIVLEGECEVVRHGENGDGKEVILATLAPYDHFGEMSFFHEAPHSAGVRAKSPLKLIRISRSAYNELIADGAMMAYKLATNTVESLADRLRRMDDWVTRLVAEKSTDHREREWNQFRQSIFSNWNL